MTIETLPQRHVRTLELMAEGYTNAEIGRELLVGEETIKSRVRMLLSLFGAKNRWHLVALAIRSGVIK